MKKGFIIALAVGLGLSVVGTALAYSVDVSGDFKYEFRSNHDGAFHDDGNTANKMSTEFKFSGKLDENTSFFTRFSGQVNDPSGKSTTSDFNLDQFGLKANYGNWTFSLGRQGAQLGQGSIFYAGNDINPLTYFDGLVATGKLNNLNVKVVAGKAFSGNNKGSINNAVEDNYFDNQNWLGLDLSSNIDNVTLGAVLAKKTSPTSDANYWGVNASTNLSKNFALNGEFARSNASSDTNAYTIGGTYSWDKSSFTIAYNSVQANSVDLVNSAIGGVYYPNYEAFMDNSTFQGIGYKGFTYAYHHDLSKALGFNAYLLSLKKYNNSPGTDNEFGANLKWSF
ncbi:gram-negative porin [Lucifera butyrica]|uniref:Gram-negative porin n=1 Tax=Lucifera butyrica TaxID=1351585 RepID=A0A498RGX6_9FIRM|nr:porin [Lucifera butyrica]VBB09363.1 gram-negative porin [Lucifera butyrica]